MFPQSSRVLRDLDIAAKITVTGIITNYGNLENCQLVRVHTTRREMAEAVEAKNPGHNATEGNAKESDMSKKDGENAR